MWKLVLPLLAWLVHARVLGYDTSSSNFDVKPELEAKFDKIAEDFLSSLSIAHSKAPSRKKRDLDSDLATIVDDAGVYRLQTIVPVSDLCHPALYATFLDIGNATYAICVTAPTAYTAAEVIVGWYANHIWHETTRWYVAEPTGLAAFHFKGYIYVLVADIEKGIGTDLVRINSVTGEKVLDHAVHSAYATCISIWKMKIDRKYHMAIANSAGQTDAADFASEVFTYEWTETYFDKYGSFRAYDVKDIEQFHIHGAAYLAVANFRRAKNDYKVDSEILKYNLDKKKWISHQKIRTYGAMDWEFFTLGTGISQEFFLAVANKEDNGKSDIRSIVYKFVQDKFVPVQCLPTYGATSITSYSTESTFLLAVANMEGVHLYQYDSWQFVLSRTQYTQGSMSFGPKNLLFHTVMRDYERVLILSVSNYRQDKELSVFEIGFQYENFLQDWNDESTKWCLNTLNMLESTDTDSVSRLFDDVVFIDQVAPITINGNVFFENGFGAEKLETKQLKEIVNRETYDDNMLRNLEELQRRLQEVATKLDAFEEVLRHSLRTDGSQTVYGKLEFKDVQFDCEVQRCHFDSIQTNILNGEEIANWKDNLVFLDQEQAIDGTLSAEQINATSINVLGLINGIDPRTLVTKSGDHNITGQKTFMNPITAKEVVVNGLVNGVDISATNVLLTTGLQNITGNLYFNDIETSWLEVNGFVNGIHLPTFYEDIVRSDQPATISGQKIFQDIVVDDLTMNPGSTINGIDLLDLWNNVLWTEGYQEIKAPMTFQSMSLQKNLLVPAGINGIHIPGPRVVDINSFANVTAPHVFESSTTIAELDVLNSLNGLRTFQVPGKLPELDIMLKTGDQVITGMKTFHTIHLDADSFVTGKVNGVDLSELKEIALRRDAPVESNRTWVFNNLVIKGPLFVDKISGYDLDAIYDNSLKFTDENIPSIIFKKEVQIEELVSSDINGIDIANDFVLRSRDQVLTGKKIFNQIVLEDNSNVLETVNNVDVSFLNDTILRIGNQVLKSKVLNGNVKISKLTVTGSINHVPFEDLVTLSGSETLLNSRELINVTFNEIEANNVQVDGLVNNIDIAAMMKDTMTYEGNERVLGRKTIKGAVHVDVGENLDVDFINGINVQNLFDDAVLIDIPQEISGEKTFQNPVIFDDLVFNTIDGVSDWDMRNWMLKDTPQTVTGNVFFTKGLSINNLSVKGYINGVNITELDASIVKINEPSVIEGPVIFENVLTSSGDITLSGTIQGVDISSQAVTRSGDKVISGIKTFTQDLVVEGDATVGGLVDGVSIEDICQKVLIVDKEKNITRLTIKGDVTLLGGGTIGGKVAGVNLAELREIAVNIEDPHLTFSGQKSFESLTIEGPLTIEGRLGGVDLQLLDNTYMSLSRDQDIHARMDFDDITFEGTLSARKFNTANKVVNGIDINSLNRVLRIDSTQTVTADHYFDEIIFSSDVFVAGKVNGIDIPTGLMRHNHTNYVYSPKVFEKPVHILGNLDMGEGKLIQNVDVSDWAKKAVLNDGREYQIDGYKTFTNLSLTSASVKGKIDGVEISENTLLMTYGDQFVTGRKTITNDVDIRGSLMVNGLINGKDLNSLATNTLQRGRTNSVTGIKRFAQDLTIQSLEAPTVAGIDMVELQRKVNTQLDFEYLKNRLDELGNVVANMQDAVNRQAILFQYYELFQDFTIPTAYNWLYISVPESEELLLLSDNSSSQAGCTSIRIFYYDQESRQFVAHPQELVTSYAVSVKSLLAWGITYLFVANQKSYPSCSPAGQVIGEGNSTADIYVWNGDLFEFYQQLEMLPVIDMAVFHDGRLACVVYIELHECNVYCSKGRGQGFEYLETLPTRGGRKASIVQSEGKVMLAIAAEYLAPRQNYIEDKKPVDIYIWNHESYTFERSVQVIQSTYAQSVLLMKITSSYSSEIFLVLAEGRIPRIQNEAKLLIYRYDETSGQFQKYQEIMDYGKLEWIALQTGEVILFALDSLMGQIKLYQYKGASGFVNVDTVKSIGSINAHPFIRREKGDNINHYLALAGPRAAMAESAQGLDFAKILKSKMKGNLHFINM